MSGVARVGAYVVVVLAIVATSVNARVLWRNTHREQTSAFRFIPDWRRVIGSANDVAGQGSKSRDTLVEFLDYQCPACRAMWTRTDEYVKHAGRSLVVEVSYITSPGHELALPAALAAYCAAKQGVFGEIHRLLFAPAVIDSEPSWSDFARKAGVKDPAVFETCRADPASTAAIQAVRARVDRLGGHGSPIWMIDGAVYEGLPWDFERILDRVVERAAP